MQRRQNKSRVGWVFRAEGVLARIRYIEETIFVPKEKLTRLVKGPQWKQIGYRLVLFINRAHECRRWWKYLVYKNENGLFGRQLDPFPNHINELTNSQVLNETCKLSEYACASAADSAKVHAIRELTEGTRYFFLSMVGISVLSAFSQITYSRFFSPSSLP